VPRAFCFASGRRGETQPKDVLGPDITDRPRTTKLGNPFDAFVNHALKTKEIDMADKPIRLTQMVEASG